MSKRKRVFPKQIHVIEQQCKREGLAFTRLRTPGGIYLGLVLIAGGGAHVTYRPNDGAFTGVTPTGLKFSSKIQLNEPWFKALKAFFHDDVPSNLHQRRARVLG